MKTWLWPVLAAAFGVGTLAGVLYLLTGSARRTHPAAPRAAPPPDPWDELTDEDRDYLKRWTKN